MPQLIYPRSLIESWYRISQGKGGVSANSPRFEATAWSDSASYENPDEMGGTEGDDSDSTVDVTGGLGNYGSMRDYTGDDELGYSEVGADRQVDNQGHTTVTKNAMNTVEKENQQRSKQLVRFERIELFQGISRSARRVMSAYEAAGLENLPENVKKIYDAIEKMLAADPDQAKNPAMDAQNIVHMLEQLGIAARDAGVVPSGLPRVAVSPEMVIKMVRHG